MSTRSTVTIWYQPKPGLPAYQRHHLYRHWDGGLWGNGLTLAHVLRRFDVNPEPDPRNANTYWRSLQDASDRLNQTLLSTTDSTGKHAYETTSHADDHGDTEYHYDIFLDYEGGITWRYKTRKPGAEWAWQQGGNVTKLRSIVAKELQRIRRIINRRRRRDLVTA